MAVTVDPMTLNATMNIAYVPAVGFLIVAVSSAPEPPLTRRLTKLVPEIR
jgi:hypothetical protein